MVLSLDLWCGQIFTTLISPSKIKSSVLAQNFSGVVFYDKQAYLPDRRDDENSPHKIGKGYFVITYGTAAEGCYNVDVMPSSCNYEILPIHVLQRNFGVIYNSDHGGLMHPELIRDVNEEVFIDLLK